jgi:uracil-DNA glycosylase family 4
VTDPLHLLAREIHACRRCPRLAEYLDGSRRDHPEYWSRPVSGFGDPEARLYILGLAPAYRGGNQHGRVFTGDSSGTWVWSALYELGAASAPDSLRGDQPLEAYGVYIGAAVRCAPPANKPTLAEFDTCREYFARELALLPNVRVVLALGKLAHDSYLKGLGVKLSAYPFGHGAVHHPPESPYVLVDSYHPSRQNTNTGVLTRPMWIGVIREALRLAHQDSLHEQP